MSSIIFILLLGCSQNNPTTSVDWHVCSYTGSNDTDDTIDTADTTNETDDTEVIDTADTNTNVDADGDGFTIEEGDCDDDNPNANPYASEYCDGFDNNCDGIVDESSALDSTRWYEDSDGDSFGNPDSYGQACDQPDGFVSNNTIVMIPMATVPDTSEVWYDDIDQDCDPTTSMMQMEMVWTIEWSISALPPNISWRFIPLETAMEMSSKGLPLTLNQDKHGFRKTPLQTPKMY